MDHQQQQHTLPELYSNHLLSHHQNPANGINASSSQPSSTQESASPSPSLGLQAQNGQDQQQLHVGSSGPEKKYSSILNNNNNLMGAYTGLSALSRKYSGTIQVNYMKILRVLFYSNIQLLPLQIMQHTMQPTHLLQRHFLLILNITTLSQMGVEGWIQLLLLERQLQTEQLPTVFLPLGAVLTSFSHQLQLLKQVSTATTLLL